MRRPRREGVSVLTGSNNRSEGEAFQSELCQYRYETAALLQKFWAMSLDLGRLPSVLGGELFRSKVTSYRITSFEDLVIFVIDFSTCFNRLSDAAQRFIALHSFQEHTKEEAAARMGCDVRNARRIYCDALDELTEILLRFGVIEPIDWIGSVVAEEGWFEGCPVLRRNAWSARGLPPKKPAASVRPAVAAKAMRTARRP